MKKSSNTPRPYLSYSQFSLFERSPEAYERVYFFGETYDNAAMRLGKKVAEALETGETEENGVAHLNTFFPKCPKVEFPIKVNFEGIPLYGKLDTFDPKKLIIRERKTGKKWTQAMADRTDQLTFYTALVWKKYGKMPTEWWLDWARTELTVGLDIRITGDIQSFRTERTKRDLFLIYPRIERVWKEIKKMGEQNKKVFL